jgi:hypothetical protein
MTLTLPQGEEGCKDVCVDGWAMHTEDVNPPESKHKH